MHGSSVDWRAMMRRRRGLGLCSLHKLESARPRLALDSRRGYKRSYDFLFLNARGNLFIAENVVRQALCPILDALKIPRCGFHAFRHTHASLLLSSGAASSVTQAQLRHSDARITLGIYGHIVGDEHREAVEKVASILDPRGPKSSVASQLIQ